MKEINITQIVNEAEHGVYSGSAFELGDNAGRFTWNNCLRDFDNWLELTDDEIAAARDHFAEYGAWNREEIDDWSRDEVTALVFQEINASIRELEQFIDDDGEYDLPAIFEAAESGRISGRVSFTEGDEPEWFYYIGL
jgi:hypothetical protein